MKDKELIESLGKEVGIMTGRTGAGAKERIRKVLGSG